MKSADEVGKDFDEYARRWAEQNYALEVAWDGTGVQRDEAGDEVKRPGDEWGESAILRRDYTTMVAHLGLTTLAGRAKRGSVNVLEIGAGGGRSTEALISVLGDAIGDYHVIDVADAFIDTLRARIDRPLDIHIVSDVDTSFLAPNSIDLCLAQSSWSHINLYDQYRYLRDVRMALKHRAPIVVSGLFVLGTGDEWTWNRFRRRVYQIDHRVSGVYHEFTSVSLIAEMLTRLGYTDITVFSHGFSARRGSLVGDNHLASIPDVRYRYVHTLADWAGGNPGYEVVLPVPNALAVDGSPAQAQKSRPTAAKPTATPRIGTTRVRAGLRRRARRLRAQVRGKMGG